MKIGRRTTTGSPDKEIACWRVWDIGSVEEAIAMEVQCSPFGVIPMKNKPGKWRLILNLSAQV